MILVHSLLLSAVLLAGAPGAQAPADKSALPLEDTAAWAIQSDGRLKPLETFAHEQILAVTGKSSIDGLDPLEFLWGFRFDGNDFRTREFIRVNSRELRAALGLDIEKLRFSLDSLMSSRNMQDLVLSGIEKERARQRLDILEADALKVYDRLQRAVEMMNGEALRLVPLVDAEGRWATPQSLATSSAPELKAVHDDFVQLENAYRQGDAAVFAAAAGRLGPALRQVDPAIYPTVESLEREQRYNRLNAFGTAWKFYLAGFLLLAFLGRSKRRTGFWLGFAALAAGLVFHSYGVGLRWQIAGRAPVSDMYESLVFMGWGIIAIGLVLEAVNRKGYFGMAAGLMGFIALAFAENLPIDSAISPLVPVLANTSWLAIHVMTIMLAYSAFALSLGIAHIVLAIQLFRPGKTVQLRSLSSLLYKCLQVGVLFLAAGIAFGAIWANESWGRYWGWDPKETWSLITFFVYMALVHARFAGWLQNFGLALSSILAFQAVIMTYYGVNFILGAGLHSYGFSSGGIAFLIGYLGLEALIIGAAVIRYRSAIAPQRPPEPAPA